MIKKKFILGTANFGIKYGFKNKKIIDAKLIIKSLLKNKINWFDTSSSYINSEKIIGKIKSHLNIITKVNFKFKQNDNIEKVVRQSVEDSFRRLKKKKIYAFLIQKSNILLSKNGRLIYKVLNQYKKEKKIKKIGISSYNFNELKLIIKKFKIDIVQVPFNLVNDELITSNSLEELKKNNIEVHVRSIFLQGLLLIKSINLPKKFSKLKRNWKKLEKYFLKNNLTPLEACIKFVLSFKKIDKIIIGVENINQLNEILNIKFKLKSFKKPNIYFTNKKIMNPINWSKLK